MNQSSTPLNLIMMNNIYIDQELKNEMEISKKNRIKRFGKRLVISTATNCFPAISITGTFCELNCKHCRGKLLNTLLSAKDGTRLEKIAYSLVKKNARGILLTGGCDRNGKVPIINFSKSIKKIKSTTDLIVIAHTGIGDINEEEALQLKDSGLDGIAIDVVGAKQTVKNIYGLDIEVEEYIKTLQNIEKADLPIFPHICIGLDHGILKGEFNALQLLKNINPKVIILTGLMPIKKIINKKPNPLDFVRVITYADKEFSETPIVLGCARSYGSDRELIDILSIESGINGVAIPTQKAVDLAVKAGYEIKIGIPCYDLDRIE